MLLGLSMVKLREHNFVSYANTKKFLYIRCSTMCIILPNDWSSMWHNFIGQESDAFLSKIKEDKRCRFLSFRSGERNLKTREKSSLCVHFTFDVAFSLLYATKPAKANSLGSSPWRHIMNMNSFSSAMFFYVWILIIC